MWSDEDSGQQQGRVTQRQRQAALPATGGEGESEQRREDVESKGQVWPREEHGPESAQGVSLVKLWFEEREQGGEARKCLDPGAERIGAIVNPAGGEVGRS